MPVGSDINTVSCGNAQCCGPRTVQAACALCSALLSLLATPLSRPAAPPFCPDDHQNSTKTARARVCARKPQPQPIFHPGSFRRSSHAHCVMCHHTHTTPQTRAPSTETTHRHTPHPHYDWRADSVCTVPTVLTTRAPQTNGVPRFKTWTHPRVPLVAPPACPLWGRLLSFPRALCFSAPGWLPPNVPLIFISALSFLGCLVRGTYSTYRHSTVSRLNEGRKVPPALRSRLFWVVPSRRQSLLLGPPTLSLLSLLPGS